MFTGNIYYRGDISAAEEVLHEATQLANMASVKKEYLGVPNFREQFVLSTGATLDVVLGEHAQFITIVGEAPVEEEELEEELEEYLGIEHALFCFRPESGYPQVIVVDDGEGSINLQWADNIHAGPLYTQWNEDEELIVSLGMYWAGEAFQQDNEWYYTCYQIDSPNANEFAGSSVHIGGYTIYEYTGGFSTRPVIIGAGIVEDELLCFVRATNNNLIFYSYPFSGIDYTAPEDTILIDNIADMTLVKSVPWPSWMEGPTTIRNNEVTTCTFNKYGTEAVLAALKGVESDDYTDPNAETWRRQEICDISLSIDVLGNLQVSETFTTTQAQTTGGQTVAAVDIANTYANTVDSGFVWNCNTALRLGSVQTVLTYDSMADGATASTVDASGVIGPYKIAVSMLPNGEIEHARLDSDLYDREDGMTIAYMSTGAGGFRYAYNSQKGPWRGQPELGDVTYGYYAHDPSRYFALMGAWNTDEDGVTTMSSNRTMEYSVSTTYTFPWGTIANEDVTNLQYNYDVDTPVSTYTVRSETYFASRPECGVDALDYTVDDTITIPDVITDDSGSATRVSTEATPLQYSVRDGYALVKRIDTPYKTTSLANRTWPAPDYTLKKSSYITLEADGASFRIPNFTEFNGNLDQSYNCIAAYNADLAYTGGFSSQYTAYTPVAAPDYSDISIAVVKMLTNPRGYAMFSMSDYILRRDEDSFSETTGTFATCAYVHVKETGEFVDLVDRYNALLEATDELTLAPLTKTFAAVSAPVNYGKTQFLTSGVLDRIPSPTIDFTIY